MSKINQLTWSSRLSFILATTGAAVGLGNIWKVPYEFGHHGGGAFVLIYTAALLAFGIPMVLSEFVIGLLGKQSPPRSLQTLSLQFNASKKWKYLGYLGLGTLLLILSFYSVVSGWIIDYIMQLIIHPSQIPDGTTWDSLQNQPQRLLLGHGIFIFLTAWVVARGIHRGIETASKIMLPLLFLLLIIIVCWNTLNPGFSEAVNFLFKWRAHQVNAQTILSAMGHAFFTLALGAGCLLMYASYLPPNSKVGSSVLCIALLDLTISLLSGLAVYPFIFAAKLPIDQGPKLLFVTLPGVLSLLPFAWLWMLSFFTLLLFAAWTSSISLAEPIVRWIEESGNYSRTQATFIIALLAFLIGIPSALSISHNPWIKGADIFTWVTAITTDYLLPLGGLGFTLFSAWVIPSKVSKRTLQLPPLLYHLWHFSIRYLAPSTIIIVVINGALS